MQQYSKYIINFENTFSIKKMNYCVANSNYKCVCVKVEILLFLNPLGYSFLTMPGLGNKIWPSYIGGPFNAIILNEHPKIDNIMKTCRVTAAKDNRQAL